MNRLLHISASPNGADSYSRRFGTGLVAGLQRLTEFEVVERDLAAEPLPYPGLAFVHASLMPEHARGPEERDALSLSEALITEFEAADTVVMDSPMHNFTVPAALKTWIDYVVRPNRTFRSHADGKVGMLEDRPVYVVITCGGRFDPAAGGQTDFLTPYLRHVLGTIGLQTVHTLRLESLRRGEAALAQAQVHAEAWIKHILSSGDVQTRTEREEYCPWGDHVVGRGSSPDIRAAMATGLVRLRPAESR